MGRLAGKAVSAIDCTSQQSMESIQLIRAQSRQPWRRGEENLVSLPRRLSAFGVASTSFARRSVGWGRRRTSPRVSRSSTTVVAFGGSMSRAAASSLHGHWPLRHAADRPDASEAETERVGDFPPSFVAEHEIAHDRPHLSGSRRRGVGFWGSVAGVGFMAFRLCGSTRASGLSSTAVRLADSFARLVVAKKPSTQHESATGGEDPPGRAARRGESRRAATRQLRTRRSPRRRPRRGFGRLGARCWQSRRRRPPGLAACRRPQCWSRAR